MKGPLDRDYCIVVTVEDRHDDAYLVTGVVTLTILRSVVL